MLKVFKHFKTIGLVIEYGILANTNVLEEHNPD
jgi:hypothetical protein